MTDRELDALVATHVMALCRGVDFWPEQPHEWRNGSDDERCRVTEVEYSVERLCGCPADVCVRCGDRSCHTMAWHKPDHATCEKAPPRYSTSIADAWLVVEEMRRRGGYFFIDTHPSDNNKDGWFWAEFVDDTEKEGSALDRASAPRAICLAALRALGVEVTA